MSLAQEAQTRAREIRARLIRPPNAVPDFGIDLKRLPKGTVLVQKKEPEPVEVLEYSLPLDLFPATLPPTKVLVDFKSILTVVAQYFSLGVRDLMGPSRKPKYTHPRHLAIYLATIHTDLSASAIGLKLYRDHSTILHGKWKIADLVAKDSNTAQLIKELEGRLLAEQILNPFPALSE
jgi:hypothetical protein